MNFKVDDKWKDILTRAWSVRFILLAGFLTGMEGLLSFFGESWLPGPMWLHQMIVFGVLNAAFVARLAAQKGL
jgi:hypothetical protein